MATNSDIKEDPLSPSKTSDFSILNDDTLADLLKKQLTIPQMQFFGGTPFTEYVDKNAVFFSKLENLKENEKTAYLLGCLSDEVYRLLKLSRPNTALASCKYSELVDDLTKFYTETIKYAKEYTNLLLPNSHYSDNRTLHMIKKVEWKSLEELTSQKIPDLVKVIILFDHYKEPVKSIAERYIQEHHDNLNLSEFITHMETESLFINENSDGKKCRRKKLANA
uniref:Uncharacterized protein n=1 Tax=Strongyloides papillosus TaxID=174720 RepID=A0A0N5B751_STREA